MSAGRLLRTIPFAAGVTALAWFSSVSLPNVLDSGWDKPAHVAVFAILGWTAQLATHADGRTRRGRALLGVALTAAYGLIDEWIQSGTPGRFPSAGDAVADLVGALVGAWIWTRRPVGPRDRGGDSG